MRPTWLSVDRLPLIGLAVLLLVSWLGADYYVANAVQTTPNPFLRVWVAYSPESTRPLVLAALLGLAGAAAIPLRDGLPLGDLRAKGAASIGWLFPLWVFVAVAGILLSVAASGEYLLEAPVYLASVGPSWLVSLAVTLQPLSILASGVISNRWRLVSILFGILWLLILFSGATRFFAGVIILMLIGRVLGGGRVPVLGWLIGVAFTVLALPVPLFSRGLPAHGLIPYSQALLPELSGGNYLGHVFVTAAENIGFTAPLLVFTSRQPGISVSDMAISLNPGPGALVGWGQITDSMRVHEFIPYSSLGEFASFGLPALVVWCFAWGLLIRLCVSSVVRNSSPLMVLFLAAELGLGLISMVLMTQYNTRAVSRVVGMMIAIAIAERLTRNMFTVGFWIDSRAASVPARTGEATDS